MSDQDRFRPQKDRFDVIVIGGGFFGCCLSLYYREAGRSVLIVDAARELLTRASFVNQARVHNGYHYPRSLLTAIRSRVNFPRFIKDFDECIVTDFDKVYAIARNNSKVTAFQFERFCETAGAPIEPAPKEIQCLFNDDLIESSYLVTEYAFNSSTLREVLIRRMKAEAVELRLETQVARIEPSGEGLLLTMADGTQAECDSAVIATYARINQILHDSGLPILPMKHEIAEVALIHPAPELAHAGITVMDGPFFSTMPFPALGAFSLTHVRYTPHESWLDEMGYRDPYLYLERNPPEPRTIFMLRDAQRYLPAIRQSEIVGSLFEVKTTLPQNEGDDGRPILYRSDYGLPGLSVVMGGKIDNIYDILHAIQKTESKSENSNLK